MHVFEEQAPSRRKPSWYGLTSAVVACIDSVFAYFCLQFTVQMTILMWELHLERRELSTQFVFTRFQDLIKFFNESSLLFLLFWIGILLQVNITIENARAANVVYKMSKYPTGSLTVSLWERSKDTKGFMWFYQGFILSCDVIEITVFVLFFKGLWGVEVPMLVFLKFWIMIFRCVAFLRFEKVVSNRQPFLPQPL